MALDLADPRFEVLILRKICFLVIALGQYIVALFLYWRKQIFILQLVVAPCTSILTLVLSEEQLLEQFPHGKKYH